jgi:hypothetical protein
MNIQEESSKTPGGSVASPFLATPEPFVDADKAAEFLSITRRRIMDLARHGALPAYPLGEGQRRVWRFRLSELALALLAQGVNCARQSPAPKETIHNGAW